MKTLSSVDQAKLDQLIFENRKIEAILLLKNALGVDLPQVQAQLLERYQALRKTQGDRFTVSDSDYWKGSYS